MEGEEERKVNREKTLTATLILRNNKAYTKVYYWFQGNDCPLMKIPTRHSAKTAVSKNQIKIELYPSHVR